jgi:PAS domain-containing protein
MFSTLFYQSPVMNCIADAATGRYIDVNENFAEFCGLSKEEIIGIKRLLILNYYQTGRKKGTPGCTQKPWIRTGCNDGSKRAERKKPLDIYFRRIR